MSTIFAKITDSTGWNDDLTKYKYSLFHLKEWVESVANPDLTPIYIDIFENESKIGKIAGLIVSEKKWLYGRQLFFYSGPSIIYVDKLINEKCISAIYNFAVNNGFSRVFLFPLDSKSPESIDLPFLKKYQYFEYVLKLKNEYLHHKHGSGIQKKLNLALKANTEFHKSETPIEDMLLMVKMMEKTKQLRLQKSRKDYKLFSIMYVNLKTLYKLIHNKLGVVYYSLNNGEKHFVTLSLEHNNQVYGLYNGTDEFGYKNGLPGFMATKLAHYYMRNGADYFNLGASLDNKEDEYHLSNFKKQIGCIPQPVFTYKSDYLVNPQKTMVKILKYAKNQPYINVSWLKRIVK